MLSRNAIERLAAAAAAIISKQIRIIYGIHSLFVYRYIKAGFAILRGRLNLNLSQYWLSQCR